MAYQEYEVKVYDSGDKSWYQNGKLHRTDGPAQERANGDKFWYQNGEIHRLGGPAVEYTDGTKWWCQNGQYHRTDGPAIEYADGSKFWYIEGKQYTETEFEAQTEKKIDPCNGKVVEIDGKKYTLNAV